MSPATSPPDVRITRVDASPEGIALHLSDGRILTRPWAVSPRLAAASPEARAVSRITGDGRGVHWPLVDEDLSLSGLLTSLRITEIRMDGRPRRLVCDEQCEKAWGIHLRPRTPLSADEDDYAFLADGELGTAPTQPPTWEGGDGKPQTAEERHNKWCARECERAEVLELHEPVAVHDFRERLVNCPHLHPAAQERTPARGHVPGPDSTTP